MFNINKNIVELCIGLYSELPGVEIQVVFILCFAYFTEALPSTLGWISRSVYFFLPQLLFYAAAVRNSVYCKSDTNPFNWYIKCSEHTVSCSDRGRCHIGLYYLLKKQRVSREIGFSRVVHTGQRLNIGSHSGEAQRYGWETEGYKIQSCGTEVYAKRRPWWFFPPWLWPGAINNRSAHKCISSGVEKAREPFQTDEPTRQGEVFDHKNTNTKT